MTLKAKLSQEKPWAIIGMSRKQYMASRPWAKLGNREKFEELLLVIHEKSPELIEEMQDQAQADALVEMIFGSEKTTSD